MEKKMINFNNKKNKQIFSAIIISIGNGCADGGISPALLIIT
jgi:hypothetical protein